MSLIPELPDESYNIPHVHAGIVGMVKKGNRKHSGQCQFYITLTEMKSFDQLYVAFGRIIQGFGIIKEIENVDVYLQKPTRRITVEGCGEYII